MLQGINILVAEDNLVNQKIVNYILTKQRANVIAALNGQEAIDILLANPIDIILMDLQMPGMDGFEATRHIREQMKSSVPVIALTADMFANDTDDYLDVGINAFISKPFDPQTLCDLILKLVDDYKKNV